jgi:enoyl-CoA hydratase
LTIDRSTTNGIAVITLDNPRHRNALTPAIADEFVLALDDVDADPSVGALILASRGEDFCSGADLRVLEAAEASPLADEQYVGITKIYNAFRRFGAVSVPTIAAVQGAAVGAGLNLALAADLRLASEDAKFISGFLRIGIHPGGGHLHLLDRVVNRDTIAAMAIFGEIIDGRDAVRLGIAWRTLPREELLDHAMHLARRVAENPELARAATRSLRLEIQGPISWDAAISIERGPQMWSMYQRSAQSRMTHAEGPGSRIRLARRLTCRGLRLGCFADLMQLCPACRGRECGLRVIICSRQRTHDRCERP